MTRTLRARPVTGRRRRPPENRGPETASRRIVTGHASIRQPPLSLHHSQRGSGMCPGAAVLCSLGVIGAADDRRGGALPSREVPFTAALGTYLYPPVSGRTGLDGVQIASLWTESSSRSSYEPASGNGFCTSFRPSPSSLTTPGNGEAVRWPLESSASRCSALDSSSG